jgi:hypothetical protein
MEHHPFRPIQAAMLQVCNSTILVEKARHEREQIAACAVAPPRRQRHCQQARAIDEPDRECRLDVSNSLDGRVDAAGLCRRVTAY